MRVLVAFGDEHRAYREVIAAGIRILRPRADVATATPAEIDGEIGRFDPQVVVCGRAGIADPGDVPAWVELPVEPLRPGKIRVGARRRTSVNLELEGLLAIVDEAEELVGGGRPTRASGGRPSGQGVGPVGVATGRSPCTGSQGAAACLALGSAG
jgi:hypothetical protein